MYLSNSVWTENCKKLESYDRPPETLGASCVILQILGFVLCMKLNLYRGFRTSILLLSWYQHASRVKVIAFMSKLLILDIHGNQLTELPPAIGSLSGSHCYFMSICLFFVNLMDFIILFYIRIHILHFTILLKALKQLDASNNHIALIPETINQCSNLQHLNLHSNHIKFLPHTIGKVII